MIVSGDPSVRGAHYGYRSLTEGPGDDAFEKCKKWVVDNKQVMMIMPAKDSCPICQTIAGMINMGRRALSGIYAWRGHLCTYFRVADNLAFPKASDEAYNFCIDEIKCPSPCHHLCMYGIYPNGKIYTNYMICPTTTYEFAGVYGKMIDSFFNKYPTST